MAASPVEAPVDPVPAGAYRMDADVFATTGPTPSRTGDGDEPVAEAARKLRALIMAGERYRVALTAATGLGTTESQAVGYLFVHGSRGQTDLARDLGLTSSAATALVDRLERRGVAVRTRHSNDRRRLQVALTEHGERLAVESQEPLLDTLGLVPESELTTVATWLGVMADHLQARSV